MQLRNAFSLLSVFFFIHKTLSETIARGPSNLAADVGVWANFTCSVSCDYLITWYVEGYPSDISATCSNTLNNMMVCKQTTHQCSTGGASNYSETLRVLAKAEHAGSKIAVQCSAVSRSGIFGNRNSCEPFVTYSRFALLSVNELPESTTPTPTPCSTVPQDVPTVTETSTVTVTEAASTVTETVTVVSRVTVVQEPNITPPPLPPPNSALDTRRQLGTILTQMFMWVFTLGVGALFASMAVLR